MMRWGVSDDAVLSGPVLAQVAATEVERRREEDGGSERRAGVRASVLSLPPSSWLAVWIRAACPQELYEDDSGVPGTEEQYTGLADGPGRTLREFLDPLSKASMEAMQWWDVAIALLKAPAVLLLKLTVRPHPPTPAPPRPPPPAPIPRPRIVTISVAMHVRVTTCGHDSARDQAHAVTVTMSVTVTVTVTTP
jgi:hypothetical protein